MRALGQSFAQRPVGHVRSNKRTAVAVYASQHLPMAARNPYKRATYELQESVRTLSAAVVPLCDEAAYTLHRAHEKRTEQCIGRREQEQRRLHSNTTLLRDQHSTVAATSSLATSSHTAATNSWREAMAAKHSMVCLALEVMKEEKAAGLLEDKATTSKMGPEMDKLAQHLMCSSDLLYYDGNTHNVWSKTSFELSPQYRATLKELRKVWAARMDALTPEYWELRRQTRQKEEALQPLYAALSSSIRRVEAALAAADKAAAAAEQHHAAYAAAVHAAMEAEAVLQEGIFDLAVPFWASLRQQTSSLSKVFASNPVPAFSSLSSYDADALSSSSSSSSSFGSSSNDATQAQAIQVGVSAALLASGYYGFAALAAFAGPFDSSVTSLLGAQALLLLAGAASASLWMAGSPSASSTPTLSPVATRVTPGATQLLVLQRVPDGLRVDGGINSLSTIDAVSEAATAMLSLDMDGLQPLLVQQQVTPAAGNSRGFKGAIGGMFRSARGVARGVVRAVTGR